MVQQMGDLLKSPMLIRLGCVSYVVAGKKAEEASSCEENHGGARAWVETFLPETENGNSFHLAKRFRQLHTHLPRCFVQLEHS